MHLLRTEEEEEDILVMFKLFILRSRILVTMCA